MSDLDEMNVLIEYCCRLEQNNLHLAALTEEIDEGNRIMHERVARYEKRMQS